MGGVVKSRAECRSTLAVPILAPHHLFFPEDGVPVSKALRLSEKWFQRGLWLVAFVFAAFLIGLGGTVVGDLPQVESALTQDDFIEQPAATQLRESLKKAENQGQEAQEALDQAKLKLRVAQANSRSASETFNNWLATRRATERPEQDAELIERTRALDVLKTAERQALATMEAEQQKALDASQSATRAEERIAALHRRHSHHRAGRATGDCFAEPLPGKAETGRATARCAAP